MASQIIVSHGHGDEFADKLQTCLAQIRPKVIGVASAFVSVWGTKRMAELLRQSGRPQCRLIAGTSRYITHPEALYSAVENGWELRLGHSSAGIFHPKLVVGGARFQADGKIENASFVYVGSANLTKWGLTKNTECGLLSGTDAALVGASDSFANLWNTSQAANGAALKNYAATFAEINRRRPALDLEALEVSDEGPVEVPTQIAQLLTSKPPKRAAVKNDFAEAAWVGLQSFTGAYAFQIEFPRAAGEVVNRLVRRGARSGAWVDVLCMNDNQNRRMKFWYYSDNSMFRLNVPNDVPRVQWVRQHKDGLSLVQRGPAGGAPIRLTICSPGGEANEIIARSLALGTWGKTQTRLYGWY